MIEEYEKILESIKDCETREHIKYVEEWIYKFYQEFPNSLGATDAYMENLTAEIHRKSLEIEKKYREANYYGS